MQTLLLIENDELAVLVGLLQDVLALLDVAVVIFQAEEGGHQCHIGLNGIRTCHTHSHSSFHSAFEAQLNDLRFIVEIFLSTIKSRSM